MRKNGMDLPQITDDKRLHQPGSGLIDLHELWEDGCLSLKIRIDTLYFQ